MHACMCVYIYIYIHIYIYIYMYTCSLFVITCSTQHDSCSRECGYLPRRTCAAQHALPLLLGSPSLDPIPGPTLEGTKGAPRNGGRK